MLTNRTRASLVQLLEALSSSAVRVLLLKHLDENLWPINTHELLSVTETADGTAMAGLLVELVGGGTSIRANAPAKYVFDTRLEDLRSNLRADGFEVIEGALVRLLPGAEPVARITDSLEGVFASSDLDRDGEIRRLLRESHEDLAATPPDFNGGTTKARIALETVVRRSAAKIASSRMVPAPDDRWGAALAFLKDQEVVTTVEEEALAKVYTLISSGAHVPRGLTDEQWALLARTFAVSGAYFLTHKHLVT
ncbi:MAG: hypothetical protein WEA09_02420 [Gemmatimonadota bacterium]